MATASSSKSKQRKRSPEKDAHVSETEKLTIEQYEQRIENLIVNNQALSSALKISQQSVQQQEQLIAFMQNKLLYSQIPKLVQLRLEIMGKMIEQLTDLYQEVKTLVNNAPPEVFSDMSPTGVSTRVDKNVGTGDSLQDNISLKQESLSHDSSINQQMPLLTVEDNIHNNDIQKEDSHNNDSRNNDIHKEDDSTRKDVVPVSKSRSSLAKDDKLKNTPMSDDLMLLPASTSKTNPRLPRKRATAVSASKKKFIDRCKKPESYRIGSSSDEDSMDSKKRKIKIKFRSSSIPGKRKPVKGSNASTASTKKNKSSVKQNGFFNDKEVLEVPGNDQKDVSVKVNDTSAITGKGSKSTVKQSDVSKNIEVVDLLNDDRKSAEDADQKSDAMPSVVDLPEVKFLNISNNISSSPSSKISSPPINKKKGPKPKKKRAKKIYEKKKSSKKLKVENFQEAAAKTKELDDSKLKTKSPEEMKSNCMGVEKEEEKLNGTFVPKSRKANKTASITSFFNEDVKVKEEDKMNNKLKKPSIIPSMSGNRSRSTSVDFVNNQPQVVLMDIFTSQQTSADPIITKSWEEYRASTRLENTVEDLDKLIPDVEEIQPFDLELECVSDDEPLTLENHTKTPDISPAKSVGEEEPSESEISTPDANCILGLNENSSVLPSFGSVQFAKDCSEVKQNSVDNSLITLDTIDKLLASVCPENCFNKEFERDERLVFTYS